MAQVLHRKVATITSYGTQSGTTFARLTGNKPNAALHPVIVNHGWAQSSTAEVLIDQQRATAINALLASGYTLYLPFTGSNWGHPTVTYPSVGGTALTAFDHMRTAATADGLDASTVHLLSTSMGGCNAMNWAWRNPTLIASVYLICPLTDFASSWDTAMASSGIFTPYTIQQSMLGVYGAVDKASLLVAATASDPAQNQTALAVIGARTKAMLATADEVVPYAYANAILSDAGATVDTQPGSHFYPTTWTDWSEYTVAAWFQANP